MIQIKKTILTLVALFAISTGAWADYTVTWEGTTLQGIAVSSNSVHAPNTTQTVEGITVTASKGDFFYNTTYPTGPVVMAESSADNGLVFSAENNIKSIAITFTEIASYGGSMTFGAGAYTYQVSPAAKSFALPKNDTFTGITKVVFTLEGDAPVAASAVTVDWNKTSGTFDMPGGNVELEPEYYPQAVLATGGAPTAINDVPATTDGAIVNAGTVATIGETTNAQGTVMYHVSTTTLDDAALLALAADDWKADVPTAESFTAAGTAHVYYYVRGNDGDTDDENFSDGDILSTNALTVTIAAAPTYAVTFADDLAEPTEWTASPNANVTKGQPVTVTYTGTKKVLGVKAEKKAKAVPVTAITLNKTETSIKVGATETLSVTSVLPEEATDKTYTWKTSDETKATVDQDGKVTAVAAGTVTIYAEANDGSGVKGSCSVTVTPATITVTINQSDFGDWGTPITKDGVTVSAGMIDPMEGNLMSGGTFSTTLGNFTKIEVTCEGCSASGTGWSSGRSSQTWAGTPASTVSFSGNFMGMGMGITIVCTIVPTN